MSMSIWTKHGAAIRTVFGPFDVEVRGSRGDWGYALLWRPGHGKTAGQVRDYMDGLGTKVTAKQYALQAAQECMTEEAAALEVARNSPITFAKLEAALEKARGAAARDRLSCSYDGGQVATLDSAESIVDNFISSLIQALDPEHN